MRSLVLRERVQQLTAEQIGVAPQSPEEVVEAVTSVPRERVQLRTAGKLARLIKLPFGNGFRGCGQGTQNFLQEQGITEVPKTASQDQRLQHTVKQAWSGRTGETRRKERGA